VARELKAVEDQIDAVLAAYIAAHWWYWGLERNEVLGNARTGYIVVPRRQTPELRVEHQEAPLQEEDVDPNPIAQFQRWFDQAHAAHVHEPNAMTLATSTEDGQPSARMVLLKEAGQDGFVFYTNYKSRKGRELDANPRAALVFFWPELHRQVRITGQVEKTSRVEADAYFQTRPRGAQLGAWASWQTSVIPGRDVPDARVERLDAKYANEGIPTPPHWGGYRLRPDAIEFWQGRLNRLHDRLRYQRAGDRWNIERLAP